ncbi:MAG: hypothetical protein WAN46_17150, partial [Gammaproteobacteria bacterium]
LWTDVSELGWDLELRLSEKQGLEFRLLAPDEPKARAAFEAAYPEKVDARQQLIAALRPPSDLFDSKDEFTESEEGGDLSAEDEGLQEAEA